MLIRIQDCFVTEPITPEVLARTGMHLRRHESTRAQPRESLRNGYQSPPRQHVPSAPPMSARPDAPSQRRQAPSPPEDAPGAEPASQPGHTHARPHQSTPESAHQSRGPHKEDAHSYEYRIRNSPATPRLRRRRRHQRSSTDNKPLPAHTPGPPSTPSRRRTPPLRATRAWTRTRSRREHQRTRRILGVVATRVMP